MARSGRRPAATALRGAALALAAALTSCGGSTARSPADGSASTGGVTAAGGTTQGPGATATGGTAPSGTGAIQFGTQGPWPIANRTFTSADGLQEGPVVGTTTDEAQDLWVATPSALYVMKPGDARFRRFTSRDGLHLSDDPVLYDEDYCSGAKGVPGSGDAITTVTGGAPGEVFVGYHGVTAVNGDCTDPAADRHSGKLDRVRLQADGTLQVQRLDMVSTGMGMSFWHNRTVYRMAYDHVIHPHTLYVGTDHGVDMMLPDRYRDPRPGEWTGFSIQEWMSDHLHVQVCFHDDPTCLAGGEGNARMGDWRGLAIAPDGDLWHAGRWSGGKIRWIADLTQWNMRSGGVAYAEAFGNGGSVPVFPVAQIGDVVSLSSVTVAADGSAWFGRAFFYEAGAGGIAHYLGNGQFEYHSPSSELGLPTDDVQDLVALPDGRLVVASARAGLVFWNPTTGDRKALRAGQGIPDDHVTQLELDTMVNPPALHVSTAGGSAVIRAFP